MSNLFFSCGCQYNGEVYDNTEEWLAETRCYKCEEQEEQEELKQQYDFAELIGSEKQVKWAESIRAKTIADLLCAAKRGNVGNKKENFDAVLNAIISENSAKVIIDNRDSLVRYYIKKLNIA